MASTGSGTHPSHAALMDEVYRGQRHIYDLTRKYYLFGRDTLIAGLAAKPGARVLVLGMEMPPNYGARYAAEFRQLYRSVAETEKTALVPFFLAGVADLPDPTRLFQADRIHPNESAQPVMLGNVWPALRPLIPRR